MSIPTTTTTILGTTTNTNGQTVVVYYDPASGKFYENNISTPSFYQEIVNQTQISAYAFQFSTQKKSIDINYQLQAGLTPQQQQQQQQQSTPFFTPLPPIVGFLTSFTTIPIGTPTTLTNEQLGISQSKFLSNFGQVRYPTDIGNNGQDYIKFDLIEYGTKKFEVGAGALEKPLGPRNLTTRVGATVILPIQPSINDQNAVNWGEENATAVQLMTAALSRNPDGIPNFIQSGIGQITGNTAYQDLILKQLAGMAAGINPLARTDGLIVNPNLELLFNGPTLRPFTFVFRLSPRNKTESNDVKKIIRFFKEGSAVKTTDTGLFLKAPNVFNIAYIHKSIDDKTGTITTILHPGLNQIKTCALRSVNVNYTPDGSYMTFRDGTMTSYEISLQFSELEPIYDKDYTTPDGSVPNDNYIGY
jgi:hypothetical protein